jgi:hypothetical protein
MCRNIRVLFNFDPPATPDEVNAAALQFVRKVSGSQRPSQGNQAAFDRAVREVSRVTHRLLDELSTQATPKNRTTEAEKARARSQRRFS